MNSNIQTRAQWFDYKFIKIKCDNKNSNKISRWDIIFTCERSKLIKKKKNLNDTLLSYERTKRKEEEEEMAIINISFAQDPQNRRKKNE